MVLFTSTTSSLSLECYFGRGHDYASPGACFVTVCLHGGECLLGEVVNGGMRLSQLGQVVSHYWKRIPDHVGHVELDEWVVMPNHIHGIIVIAGRGEASPASASSTDNLTPGGTHLPNRESARDPAYCNRSCNPVRWGPSSGTINR
jgi:hypothetical protein